MHRDLRDWIDRVKALGELEVIRGAHWDLEIGALVETVRRECKKNPALLFEAIDGYPADYRILTNSHYSLRRLALILGLPTDLSSMEMVRAWKDRMATLKLMPTETIATGPLMEHVKRGDEINLLEFPAPRWHELDGGRYLATGCLVITRDPDTGTVNLGTYRGMLHGKNTMGLYMSPGRHGLLHMNKYFARNEPFPVAVALGQDPVLFLCAGTSFPADVSEYSYAGAIRGEPIEVITGPVTALPLPARAEAVVEGECVPGDVLTEGPFGEWTGYYGSAARPETVIRIKAVYHRDGPILEGALPPRPPWGVSPPIERSAHTWHQMEQAGVPDIRGVWCSEVGGPFLMQVVSIKQRYAGHARQAALVASQCRSGGYMRRYTIVVDEDIDPSNLEEVMWAVTTRTDPEQDIEIMRRCWSGPLDPAIPFDANGFKGFQSRAIIDACRPYEWRTDFSPVVGATPELLARIKDKWKERLAKMK